MSVTQERIRPNVLVIQEMETVMPEHDPMFVHAISPFFTSYRVLPNPVA